MALIIEEEVTQKSSVYDAFYNNYYEGWSEAFEEYREEMRNVSEIIDKVEKVSKYYPLKQNLFDCFKHTPLDKVKVVIWTDNPHTLNRSYDNIYKELKNEYPEITLPRDNNLHKLTEQGVLFINSAMCHSYDSPKSYSNLWFRFTNIVIDILNTRVENCIHLLWGKKCQKLADTINSREVYTSSDPSSYTFYGNNHFIKTNIILKRQGKSEISWKI